MKPDDWEGPRPCNACDGKFILEYPKQTNINLSDVERGKSGDAETETEVWLYDHKCGTDKQTSGMRLEFRHKGGETDDPTANHCRKCGERFSLKYEYRKFPKPFRIKLGDVEQKTSPIFNRPREEYYDPNDEIYES